MWDGSECECECGIRSPRELSTHLHGHVTGTGTDLEYDIRALNSRLVDDGLDDEGILKDVLTKGFLELDTGEAGLWWGEEGEVGIGGEEGTDGGAGGRGRRARKVARIGNLLYLSLRCLLF